MRFLSIYTPDPKTAAAPPTAEHMEEMGKFMEEMEHSGVLLATGGFAPTSLGLRVRRADGNFSVIEGASESTARTTGFALLELESREHAIEIGKRFLDVVGDGDCELRPLMDAPPEPQS